MFLSPSRLAAATAAAATYAAQQQQQLLLAAAADAATATAAFAAAAAVLGPHRSLLQLGCTDTSLILQKQALLIELTIHIPSRLIYQQQHQQQQQQQHRVSSIERGRLRREPFGVGCLLEEGCLSVSLSPFLAGGLNPKWNARIT